MIEEQLTRYVLEAVRSAAHELGLEKIPEHVELERPPQKEFGDFSTNVAFQVAAEARRAPRQVAEVVVEHMHPDALVSSVEVAGAGFINFRLDRSALHEVLRAVIREAEGYGRGAPSGIKMQVEFVSANPTGPLHIGTARNAVLGDGLANLVDAAGHGVQREYYFNDAGKQMELFGASVEARYLQVLGRPAEIPEDGYHGDYLIDVARDIQAEFGDSLADLPPEERRDRLLHEGARRVLDGIKATLDRFGVRFDRFFHERELHDSGEIEEAVRRLREAGYAFDAEGAVWFRSTAFGDDKDRPVIRSNGAPTYFAADCAYLVDKFSRGFDRLVYVWGADHHGDVIRVKGAAQALGFDPDAVEIVLYQFVSLYRGGQQMKMSKRAGHYVTLDEMIDEIGADAIRFTLLSRSNDSPMDFDIEEVKRQSLDNPVYYVQYAHARIASVLRHAAERGVTRRSVDDVALDALIHETERDLLWRIADLPREIQTAAALRAPYRLTKYAEDLAAQFHRFYTDCRVVSDDEELTQARLALCSATKQALANVLGLIGISAPESMERIEAAE